MSALRSLSIATLAMAAIALTLASARPGTADDDVPRLELADVIGHTVCPLKVVVNEDPLRLPRRIQFMGCDREQVRQCGRAPRGAAACCSLRRGRLDAAPQCAEVYDNVAVHFLPRAGADPRSAARHVVQVPVGCACVLDVPSLAVADE